MGAILSLQFKYHTALLSILLRTLSLMASHLTNPLPSECVLEILEFIVFLFALVDFADVSFFSSGHIDEDVGDFLSACTSMRSYCK